MWMSISAYAYQNMCVCVHVYQRGYVQVSMLASKALSESQIAQRLQAVKSQESARKRTRDCVHIRIHVC